MLYLGMAGISLPMGQLATGFQSASFTLRKNLGSSGCARGQSFGYTYKL